MSPDIARDFAQLRAHLFGLQSLRDAFLSSPAGEPEGGAFHQLVPRVWGKNNTLEQSIELVAISDNLIQSATVSIPPPVDGSLEILVERDEAMLANNELVRTVSILVGWLEGVLGGGHYTLRASLSPKEIEMFKTNFWEDHPKALSDDAVRESSSISSSIRVVVLSLDFSELADDGKDVLTAGPSISPIEITHAEAAVRLGWNTQHSNFIGAFEDEVSALLGVEHAIATSSCTGAMHLSLLASGIGPGDEVIVPEITWVATGSAVRYVGAIPVFVDVDPTSWTMDVDSLDKAISPKTKAIMPVHLYGVPAPMTEIMEIANAYSLTVIEDAAPALGAQWEKKFTGSFGDFGCFSFQGAKMIVTGEGGMLVTNSDLLFERAKKLQEHGRKPGTFWIEELGYKYKMSNLQAAVGLGQVSRVHNQIERKQEINSWYREFLNDRPELSFQTAKQNGCSIDWMTSVQLGGEFSGRRDRLITHLKESGIDSRPVFPQMSGFPIWGSTIRARNAVSHEVAGAAINLPSGVNLKKQTIRRVSEQILRFFCV